MTLRTSDKISSLIKILNRINSGKRVTTTSLSEELGVSQRSICRYLFDLQNTGYPIFFDRSRMTYSFPEGYSFKSISEDNEGVYSALEMKNRMMTASATGLASFDESGNCIMCNDAFAVIVGGSRQMILQQNYNDIKSWQSSGMLITARIVMKTGNKITKDYHLHTSFGTELCVICSMTRFENNNKMFLMLNMQDISERKLLEVEVNRVNALLDDVTATIPGAVYQFSVAPDGGWSFNFVSKGIENLFEISPEDACRDHNIMTNCIIEEDRPEHRDSVNIAVKNITEWSHEHRIRTRSGALKWIKASAKPQKMPDGSIQWNGILSDITQLKTKEALLETVVNAWNRTFDAVVDMVAIVDSDCRITKVNKAMADALGKSPTDCVGLAYHKAFHGSNSSFKNCSQLVSQADKESSAIECYSPNLDKYLHVVTAPIAAEDGGLDGTVHVMRDITDRLKMEQSLKENELLYRSLFERAGDGIALISLDDGELVQVNESFAKMHGYRIQEMTGMKLDDLDLNGGVDRHDERFKRLMAGESLLFEVIHYHKDGHVFPLEVNASIVKLSNKYLMQCLHRELSKRKTEE